MEVAGGLNTAGLLDHAASEYARAAEAAGGGASNDYVIAGSLVSLRFASPALRRRLTRAFAHLAAPPDRAGEEPALTVHLWDSAATRPDGGLYHFDEPPLRGAYQPGLGTLSLLDSETNTGWHSVADAAEHAAWELACPLRQLLFWWLGARGYLQIHGAGVGGVLLVGQPGSGKSTVALACLSSGLAYAGDDYVATTLEPRPHVASLYNSAKVEPGHIREQLPQLESLLAAPDLLDAEKAILYVHEQFPEQTTSGFELEAVIVPRFDATRRSARLVQISRAAAFAALGPSTIFQLHTAGKTELASMSGLVTRLPCYALEFGRDLSRISALISDRDG